MSSVLVFESDPAFVHDLRAAFARVGFRVEVSEDASVAAELVAHHRPALVLIAAELPRASGFAICNRLKKDEALRSIPVVLVSSEATEETFEQHRRLRTAAEAYWRKPIAAGLLVERSRGLLGLGAAEPPVATDLSRLSGTGAGETSEGRAEPRKREDDPNALRLQLARREDELARVREHMIAAQRDRAEHYDRLVALEAQLSKAEAEKDQLRRDLESLLREAEGREQLAARAAQESGSELGQALHAVAELEHEVSGLRRAREEERQALRQRLGASAAGRGSEGLLEALDAQQAELASLRTQLDAERVSSTEELMRAQRAAEQRFLAEKRELVEAQDDKRARLVEAHARELEALGVEHARELERVSSSLEQELARLRAERHGAISEADERLAAERAELLLTHSRELEVRDAALRAEEARHAEAVALLGRALEEAAARHASALSEATSGLQVSRAQAKQLESSLEEARRALAASEARAAGLDAALAARDDELARVSWKKTVAEGLVTDLEGQLTRERAVISKAKDESTFAGRKLTELGLQLEVRDGELARAREQLEQREAELQRERARLGSVARQWEADRTSLGRVRTALVEAAALVDELSLRGPGGVAHPSTEGMPMTGGAPPRSSAGGV